jgi:hypothetical protein
VDFHFFASDSLSFTEVIFQIFREDLSGLVSGFSVFVSTFSNFSDLFFPALPSDFPIFPRGLFSDGERSSLCSWLRVCNYIMGILYKGLCTYLIFL